MSASEPEDGATHDWAVGWDENNKLYTTYAL